MLENKQKLKKLAFTNPDAVKAILSIEETDKLLRKIESLSSDIRNLVENHEEITENLVEEGKSIRDSFIMPRSELKGKELLLHFGEQTVNVGKIVGDDGKMPSKADLLALIKPQIAKIKKAKDGKPGKDGKTPQKGVDYFTEKDKQEIAALVEVKIPEIEAKEPLKAGEIADMLESIEKEKDKLSFTAIRDIEKNIKRIASDLVNGISFPAVKGGGGGNIQVFDDGAIKGMFDNVNFGDNMSVTVEGGIVKVDVVPSGGGHTIQDEGIDLAQRLNLNFVGAAVTVTDDAGNDATVVTISDDLTTASNGLTKVGNDVQLGGILTQDTIIDGDFFQFRMENADEIELSSNGSVLNLNGNFQLNSSSGVGVDAGTELTLKTADGSSATVTPGHVPIASTSSGQVEFGQVGNVIGPNPSTDNAIARYDGITGQLIQDSNVLISDTDDVTGVSTMQINGDPTVQVMGFPINPKLSVVADSASPFSPAMGLSAFSDTSFIAPSIFNYRARGTILAPTIVQDGDDTFAFNGIGFDGVQGVIGAQITYSVDGTPGVNDVPMEISFKTAAQGGSITNRMKVRANGDVGIGTTTPEAKLDISSTEQGVLIPRMNTLQRDAIVSPTISEFIYNTDNNKYERWDGLQWVGISINESGQIKANYTGLNLVGFTLATPQTFDIDAASEILSSSPPVIFPYSSPTGTYADLFDATRGVTPKGRLIENPIEGQVNLWRIQGNFSNKGSNNNGGLTIRVRNPVSGFEYNSSITLPSGTTSGEFSSLAITIADSASIPFPNGYVIDAETTFNDGNLNIEITSITRISQAID
jgi:hypothetical protein